MVELKYVDQRNSISGREKFITNLAERITAQGIILQTCDRAEFYSGDGFIPPEIVTHLYQVTSGLKSSFIGDTSVQGQVKRAYKEACSGNTVTSSLHSLFQSALRVGKRVRSETSISKGALTYSQAALEVICRKFSNLEGIKITILGVHNLNEKIIRCLVRKGANTVFIGNRTFSKALELSELYNCSAFSFEMLTERLLKTDILITATSAPHLVVRYEDFPRNRPMFILDLAVPRDVDRKIGEIKEVILVNLEEVEFQVNRNLGKRKSEFRKAMSIIHEETERFMSNQRIHQYA